MKCNKRIANGFNKLQVLNKSNLISYCGLRWIIWKIRFVRQRILLPTRTVISCRPTLITCISRYEIGIWFSFVKLATATIGCVQITNLFKSIERPSSTLSNPIFWRKKIWFLFLSIFLWCVTDFIKSIQKQTPTVLTITLNFGLDVPPAINPSHISETNEHNAVSISQSRVVTSFKL